MFVLQTGCREWKWRIEYHNVSPTMFESQPNAGKVIRLDLCVIYECVCE